MGYHLLHPDVPAEFGCRTIMDSRWYPPRVSRLHVDIDSWFGDAVFEVFPCYVVTQEAGDGMQHAGLSGFELRDVEVTLGAEAPKLMGDIELPKFRWLHVTGRAERHDVGLTCMSTLVVSERALAVLRRHGLGDCGHELY